MNSFPLTDPRVFNHKFRELPEKVEVLIARLSYSGTERVEIGNWLVQTAFAMHEHPRVANVHHKIVTGYPTPRVRNQVLKICRERRVHFAVMIDDDIVPDVHSRDSAVGYDHLVKMDDQRNFFPAALDFALEHPGPCVIGAPYCAGPPEERVLVSRFREKESDNPNEITGGLELTCFSRDEAAAKTGFEMVSSLPTGLILIDMRTLDVMGAPWFDYEFADHWHTELASTEDTVFSRNALYLGIPQYCAFQSWCAHIKNKAVGRPRRYPISAVPKQVEEAWIAAYHEMQEDKRPADRVNPKAKRYMGRDVEGENAPQVIPFAVEDEPDGPAPEPTKVTREQRATILPAQWLDDNNEPAAGQAVPDFDPNSEQSYTEQVVRRETTLLDGMPNGTGAVTLRTWPNRSEAAPVSDEPLGSEGG